jgi:hypothetical protein
MLFFYSNDIVLILFFLLRYITLFFRLIELMTTRGGDEKCSRSKVDRERHQSMALCFSTAVCTSNDSLNNLSLVLSFRFFLSLSFAVYLMSEAVNFECSTRRREVCERRKKRTNEQTNQRRFVYTVAIADEPTYIYFSFPNDQIGRRRTSNIVSLFVS